MLPLHLAFRNEGSASWEIIEELISAYPQAIFVKDRKGRTPLQCGIQLTQASASGSNISVGSGPQQSKTFKSIVTVLDLYSQIVISGERQRSQQDARKQVEARITQMQENHLQTLTTLKQEWTAQQVEAKREIQRLTREQNVLLDRIEEQQRLIEQHNSSSEPSQRKMEDIPNKLREPDDSQCVSESSAEIVSMDVLQSTLPQLFSEYEEYHSKFQSLMERFGRLTQERKKVLDIFNVDRENRKNDDEAILEECRQWLEEKEERLHVYRTTLSSVSAVHMQFSEGDEKKEESSIQNPIQPG